VASVSILIRAEDEPVATRLDYLQAAVRDSIAPFDLQVDAGPDFSHQVLTGTIGELQVTSVSGPSLEAARSRRLIRESDQELFKIDVQARGQSVVLQDGREAVLRPGDFTLVDLSDPSKLASSHDHEVIAVMFAPGLLPLSMDELTRLTALRFAGDNGVGGMVSSLGGHLRHHLDDYDSAARLGLAAALTDLLGVALAGRLDRHSTVPRDSRRRALLLRVRAFIDRRLDDPRLSPGEIAAAHFISVRQLHKLFEAEETTVAGWIRTRRLERFRHDLVDPAFQALSVGAIATRSGFIDAPHFTRAFRAAYGVPPAEYRRRHLAAVADR